MNPGLPAISELIHHREPAVVIDRIRSLGDDDASCSFIAEEPFWEPALIEGIAQTAAVMSAHGAARRGASFDRGWLAGVRSFVIHRRPVAGEQLVCRARVAKRLQPFVVIEGDVHAGDELIASGELKFYEVISG